MSCAKHMQMRLLLLVLLLVDLLVLVGKMNHEYVPGTFVSSSSNLFLERFIRLFLMMIHSFSSID